MKVFESWAGLLDEEDYNEFIIEPNKRIKEAKKFQPFQSFFPRQSTGKIHSFIHKVKPDVLSLDKDINEEVMETAKKNNIILQGNLDPLILYKGGKELEDEVKKLC